MRVDPTLAGSAAPVHAMGVPAARERAMKPPDRAVQRRADARLASIALLGMTLLIYANPAKALLSDLAVFVTSDGTELTLDPAFAPTYTTTDATFSFSTIAWPGTAMVTVNATVGEWQPNDINVVFVGLTDADPDTDGFQVSLSQGRNSITVRSVVSRGDQHIAQYDHVLTVWRPYTTTCHRTDAGASRHPGRRARRGSLRRDHRHAPLRHRRTLAFSNHDGTRHPDPQVGRLRGPHRAAGTGFRPKQSRGPQAGP